MAEVNGTKLSFHIAEAAIPFPASLVSEVPGANFGIISFKKAEDHIFGASDKFDAEFMLRAIISNIPCQVFIKDAQDSFKYVLANNNFIGYYRLNEVDIIDRDDFDIFDPDVAKNLRLHDSEVCANVGKIFHFDEDISFNRSRKEYFKSLKTAFTGRDGKTYLLGVCVDITESLMLQKALNKAKNLQHAKDYFFASMSHELRTPLNAVIGYSELAQDTRMKKSERIACLENICSSANALLMLIDDVLDLTRLEADQIKIKPEHTNLVELIREISHVFDYSVRKKGLALSVDICGEIPPLMLDALRMRQVLINLIGNAVKFTQKGSVRVSASFEAATSKRGRLAVEVADTGPGISGEFMPNIFNPFEQDASAPGSMTNKGTGLGLTITKRLLQKMGGKITVHSESGKGSTFTITIGNAKISCGKKCAEKAKSTTTERPTNFFTGKAVIIDDVPMNVKVLGAMLDKLGIAHSDHTSPISALEEIRKSKPAIILTDLWMPEMNGLELAAEIKRDPNVSDIPLVAVTADTTFNNGIFDKVMHKPLTIKSLQSVIK